MTSKPTQEALDRLEKGKESLREALERIAPFTRQKKVQRNPSLDSRWTDSRAITQRYHEQETRVRTR